MSRYAFYLMFIAVVTAVLLAVHRYLYIRLIRDVGLPPPWRQIATAALILLALSQPATFMVSRLLTPEAASRLLFVPYLWMGMMLYLVLWLGVADLLRAGLWLHGRFSTGDGVLGDPARRLFFARTVASVASLGTLGLAALSTRNALGEVVVRRLRIVLPRLPDALDGVTLVQLSDLHIGPTLGQRWLEGVVSIVEGLRPDIVAITGDLVDGSVAQLAPHVAPLGRLRPPMGAFFVTGNHEYYSGAEAWIAHVRSLGIRVLRNERVSVGRDGVSLDLCGVDDHHSRRHLPDHGPDLARALLGRDPSRALILLAHQPLAIFEAARHGVGLVLSGHTHGGQFWPWTYFVLLQQPYISGLHRHDDTLLYINEGTGFWGPPMRLGTRCEITHITLECPPSTKPGA